MKILGNAIKKYDQRGLFDEKMKSEKLKKGNPLVKINKLINWRTF